MVGADRPKDQFAQDSSGGAVKDDDVIGLGLDHGDALPFPVRADADLALAVMDARLAAMGIRQLSSRPAHPQTCGCWKCTGLWLLREMNWMPLSLISCRGAPCSAIARSMARHAAVAVNRRAAMAREAGMVIEDVDHPRRRSVGEGDLGAVDLPQVVGCVAFETPPGRYRAARGSRRDE